MSKEVETTVVVEEKKTMVQEFVEFVQKYGVLGLAIGFVTGKAASDFVAILSKYLIQPIVAWVLQFISSDVFNFLNIKNGAGEITFGFGEILKGLIDFLAIMLVIFLLVKYLFSKLMHDTDHSKI